MAYCRSCGEALQGTARFCPSCGVAISDGPPAEERKLATILFADLVGSTALADSTDPERTRALLNRFYDAMATEIADMGGTVEKFIGDAVLAAFGAPSALEDHADRALHAALSMRGRLAELFGDKLALRIGVNTGDVVVGMARVGSAFVTGDAVNVAARIEQAAEAGEIMVGERTATAARGAFEFGEPMSIAAKGKPSGVICRRLVCARGETGADAAVFVGREPELEALQHAFSAVVANGRPRRVTIVGEAGVGKTSLAREFVAWLRRPPRQPIVRLGRCLAYGGGSAYLPLGQIVREHLGLSDNDPSDTVRARLSGRSILGVTLGLEAPPHLHPLAVRGELQQAWGALVGELVAERPTVVLLEDLHWARPELLELLAGSLRAVPGPLLMVYTARPEVELDGDAVRLEALSRTDAVRMVERLAPTELGPDVKTFVVDRSDGNPFFLEELLRTLADHGVTDAIPSGFELPDSVLALVASRIDLLPAEEKAALQAAAVVGRTFDVKSVHELVGDRADLGVLLQRTFVRRVEGEFTFVHAIMREVAYRSLTTARRARLHARLAAWLEGVAQGDEADAARLAHHYFEAVRPEDVDLAWPDNGDEVTRLQARAVRWLRRAARLSASRYEMRDAVELLERAVGLESDRHAQAEIWREIAHANALYYDGTSFAAAMENAIALGDGEATTADLYAELAFQTMTRAGMWGTPPPGDLVGGWIELALERCEPESPAWAKALLARCYSDYDKSPTDAAEASRIADDLGDPVLRSLGYDAQATVAFVRGEYSEALAWCRRRLALADELADPEMEVFACAAAVNPAVASGRLDEARTCTLRHDEATRPLSPHHRLHGAAFLVQLEELLGNWAAVLQLQPYVEARVEENLATPCVMNARSLFVCALAHAYLGDDEEALRLERVGESLAMTGYGTVLGTPLLRLALHRNDLSAVRCQLGEPAVRSSTWFYLSAMAAHLDGLAALGERERVEQEAKQVSRPDTYLEPFALRAQGVVREDQRLIGEAVERFESFRLPWHAVQTRLLLEST